MRRGESGQLNRRLGAEFVGTTLSLAAIVGSGIMGETLSDDLGITLLVNVFGTITALGVLIWTLGPISGGHFNPAVTAVATVRREMRPTGESHSASTPERVPHIRCVNQIQWVRAPVSDATWAKPCEPRGSHCVASRRAPDASRP
jgi:hypothetical protein